MITTSLEEKKKILDFITNFSEKAKKERWASHYDTDSDSLAIRMPQLSEDARKKYFNDEFAFYMNKKNEVEGVFIEYFISNFISHHKDFQIVLKDIKKDIKVMGKTEKSVIELKQKETNRMIPELETVIINSLIPNNKLAEVK